MNKNITYIYSKIISNPSQQYDNRSEKPPQTATGGGIQLINNDLESGSCEESINITVHTTTINILDCYSTEILANFINLIP